MNKVENILPFNYSCHFSEFRDGEQFVKMHSLGMVLQGAMELDDGEKIIRIKEGELYSARKNHLVKFVKYPPSNHEFSSMSIYFEKDVLQEFAMEYEFKADGKAFSAAFIKIARDQALLNYMQSLQGYQYMLNYKNTKELLRLKQKEALFLLLQYDASLKNVLFDFAEPFKIDLEAFMQKNFHFNVRLERFAYLTGRSLSTFKRDFEKIFHETPSRWLLQRRLKEAYHLIKEKGKMASDIYLDLGFEDLSHFSYTFKKQYGVAPSIV